MLQMFFAWFFRSVCNYLDLLTIVGLLLLLFLFVFLFVVFFILFDDVFVPVFDRIDRFLDLL